MTTVTAPAAPARWTPSGKTAMRWERLILAVDPDEPDYFFVDDERTSERQVHARIPLEGVNCEDGPTWIAREIQSSIPGLESAAVPVEGLTAWFAFAEQNVRDSYDAEMAERDEEQAILRSELIDLSTVRPEKIHPLWGGNRVVRKKLILWQGDPGSGKSYTSLAMTAALTQVGHRVLILQVEDGIADTLVPRLDALGADLTRIRAFPVGKAPVLSQDGVRKLEQHMADWRPSLVIIDPVTYFLGSKVDMHRANEVREVLAALARLAETYDCAIVPIIHMNKGAAKALYRSLGSIDFSAAVRSVLMFGWLPDEPDRGRVIFHIKCNYGKEEEPLGYDVTDQGFVWRTTDLTLADIEGRNNGPSPKKTKTARDWLKALLAETPRDGAEVKELATVAGITGRTLRDVSEEGWVVKTPVPGSRQFTWSLSAMMRNAIDASALPAEDFRG
jgi:AAA domain